MANTTNRSVVVGVFHDRDAAEDAIDELRQAGFRDDQIGYAWRGGEVAGGTTNITETDTGSHAGEGLATGAVIGGLLGAAAALLIPGVGPVLAGGILAPILGGAATTAGAAVAGAAVGAAAGGLLGALAGMGVPEEEARYYDTEFQAGRVIVTVRADNRYDEARDILFRYGAYDVQNQGTAMTGSTSATMTNRTNYPVAGTGATGTTAGMSSGSMATGTGSTTDHAHAHTYGDTTHTHEHAETDTTHAHEHAGAMAGSMSGTTNETRVPVHEETLVANKTNQQVGEVQIRKDVKTETKSFEVPVTREEVHIERRDVDRPASPDATAFQGGTIRVPIREEQVEIEKRARVVGEVVVSKETTQEQVPVSGTVRREEVSVERKNWTDVMPTYRNEWQTRYGATGGRWEDWEPAYKFGYEGATGNRYQGRDWTMIEPNMRRDWESGGFGRAWDDVKNNVRETWERARR